MYAKPLGDKNLFESNKFFGGGFGRYLLKCNINKKVADKIPQPFALTIVILVGGEARTPFFLRKSVDPFFLNFARLYLTYCTTPTYYL